MVVVMEAEEEKVGVQDLVKRDVHNNQGQTERKAVVTR